MKINIDDQVSTSDDIFKVNIEDEKSRNQVYLNNSETDTDEKMFIEEKQFYTEDKEFLLENDSLDDDLFINSEFSNENSGKIVVFDKLDHINGVQLEGAQINLYKLSGSNPELVEAKMTDNSGKAIFNDLDEGNYRVIAIVDKQFFQRPEYYRWNEINIDATNKEDTVIVVNKIKPEYKKNFRL